MHRVLPLLLLCSAAHAAEVDSPLSLAAQLEARMAAGDGATLPDADAELVRYAGTADLARGDWPEAFAARAGETVCVAVSPFSGCYEFFDESGAVFWTVVPVLPTTENWVAPFRHAEGGTHPDDALYEPWRLVDVWHLTHAESAEFSGRARPPGAPNPVPGTCEPGTLVTRRSALITRGADGPATNLCFTAFSHTATNLYFTAAWPTNEPLPDATLDLYGSTNLSSRWMHLSSHPATNPPVSFAIDPATLPWYVSPTQHVHDATCISLTNLVLSPLDGITVYTNAFWSCSTNRPPGEAGFFRLGTRLDSDGDGLTDAAELLVHGTRPDRLDSDGDGVPDGIAPALWRNNPLWATNAEDADFIVDLVAPSDGSAETVLTMDGLRIPLSPHAGPWAFRLPPGRVVSCSASSSGSFFILWCGAPGGSFWDPDPVFEKPLWTDGIGNISGYHTGPGSCSLAVPVLTVEPIFPPEDPTNAVAGTRSHMTESGSVCVHEADGILRYSWNVEPSVVGQGRQPVASGSMHVDSAGLYADVAGTTGEQEGTFELTDTRLPLSGTLWNTLSTNVVHHRCTATEQIPYCSVCGKYEGADLDMSIDGLSERTLTLKHDNIAAFSLIHPNSYDESFQTVRYEISQPGYTGWIPVSGTNWTARISGLFRVRAVAETTDGRLLRTQSHKLGVQFPSEAEMAADPTIAIHSTNVWTEMLQNCTPTSRREAGCWILLDTATDTYLFTTNQLGPPTGNNGVSAIDLTPVELDSPLFPNLLHASAVYTVASLHAHTPATYITPTNRPVGPSWSDRNASADLFLPGLICDYAATLPPDDGASLGRIPKGHPADADWHVYPTAVWERRKSILDKAQ